MLAGERMDKRTVLVEAAATGVSGLSSAELFKLQTWFSPAFPVGAFSYSHGLEWTVEGGDVRCVQTLRQWISGILAYGSGRNDAIILCAAWRAVKCENWKAVSEIGDLAAALQPTAERRTESMAQGAAFLSAVAAVWPCNALRHFIEVAPSEVALPVAVGAAAAAHCVPLAPTLVAFLHGFAANLVSAGVRLVPLGQTDGLKVLAALEPAVLALAQKAHTASLDDLGSAGFLADIAAMCHETQYTRLFRS